MLQSIEQGLRFFFSTQLPGEGVTEKIAGKQAGNK